MPPEARWASSVLPPSRLAGEPQMSLQNDPLEKEQHLWSGGAAEYRKTLDADCLVAFTEMAGVSKREKIAEMAARWRKTCPPNPASCAYALIAEEIVAGCAA